jgi:hypothetical protein
MEMPRATAATDAKAVCMSGHMEMQNAPTIMPNHEEVIPNTNCVGAVKKSITAIASR